MNKYIFELKNSSIYSPITQNERHLEVFRTCWEKDKSFVSKLIASKYFTDYYKTVVVLANPKTVVNDRYAKKEIKQQVIRCDQLINYFKSLKTECRDSNKAMLKTGEHLLAMNDTERNDYLKKYADLVAEANNTSSTTDEVVEEKVDAN